MKNLLPRLERLTNAQKEEITSFELREDGTYLLTIDHKFPSNYWTRKMGLPTQVRDKFVVKTIRGAVSLINKYYGYVKNSKNFTDYATE